ncbi:MAG: hypothetical protein GYA22_07405 [Bacteroidales bacterium]|nr:hypothetical protein [Bacteroidales bacterium]
MNSVYVFFSLEGQGWFQCTVPAPLAECSYDSLVNWAAGEMKRCGYKGFLVTENPKPFLVSENLSGEPLVMPSAGSLIPCTEEKICA